MNLPNFESLRAGRPECPSDLALDRLHAKELDSAQAATLEQHVATCDDCTARMVERRAGFDALDEVDPRRMLAAIRTGVADPSRDSVGDRLRSTLRRALAPLLAVTALGAVALVSLHNEETAPTDRPVITRTKGASPNLSVIRFVDGHSVKAVSGDRFAPGDRVQFMVDLPAASRVQVVGVEASGQLYTAWPLDPSTSTLFEAGDGQLLDGAVSLDNTTGKETLYLVACPANAPAPSCRVAPRGQSLECPADCKTTPFVLEKAQ